MAAKNGLLIEYSWCTGCHSCEVACQMEHGFPVGQFGIKLAEIGPWEYEPGKWQLAYFPLPTDQCDLCEDRVAAGKEPTCVQHCQAKCMFYGTVEELATKMDSDTKNMLFTV